MKYIIAILFFTFVTGIQQAHAGRIMFGMDEEFHAIQQIETPDTTYTLAYKTTTYFFIAGVFFRDDGYILTQNGDSDRYIELTEEKISLLQAEGFLPDPMPEYSVNLIHLLFGFSLWIILALVIGVPMIRSYIGSKKSEKILQKIREDRQESSGTV